MIVFLSINIKTTLYLILIFHKQGTIVPLSLLSLKQETYVVSLAGVVCVMPGSLD